MGKSKPTALTDKDLDGVNGGMMFNMPDPNAMHDLADPVPTADGFFKDQITGGNAPDRIAYKDD